MYGDIIEVLTDVLRDAPFVAELGVNVVLVNDKDEGNVNTPLPCLALSFQNSPDADRYIGGTIKDNMMFTISVIIELANYSLSEDGGFQKEFLNLPINVRNYIEYAKNNDGRFYGLEQRYDFYMSYISMESYKARAFHNEVESTVDVFTINYLMGAFDKEQILCRPRGSVKNAEIELKDIEIKPIKDYANPSIVQRSDE